MGGVADARGGARADHGVMSTGSGIQGHTRMGSAGMRGSPRRGAVAVLAWLACSLVFATSASATWLPFDEPADLSASGQSAGTPQVAFDASGNAVAVWYRSNGTNYVVQSSFRPAGTAFAAPVNLSASGQTAPGPTVAFEPPGKARAVWGG